MRITGYGGETPLALWLETNLVVDRIEILAHHETPGFVEYVTNTAWWSSWAGAPLGDLITGAQKPDAVAGATAAMTEAIVYAEKTGLDPSTMLRAIGAGAAGSWQITNMAPRVLSGDHDPGFFIKHFIKDMHIVEEEMAHRGTVLPMLRTVLQLYEDMAEDGDEDLGTQALVRLYRGKKGTRSEAH